MQVKPSTLNVMIGRMEKNGYIEKKQDEKDSRKSRIYFTEKGRSICDDTRKTSRVFYKRGAGRTQETVK